MIQYILGLVATVVFMLLFHELGHYAAAKQYGGKASINWGGLVTTVSVPDQHMAKVYWWGIIGGAIPILVWSSTSFVGLLTGSGLWLYYLFVGCHSDFKAISKLSRRKIK